ncbi:DUF2889 domain-containing protein [Alcaligenaceae bacterium]|nr:DUF2889 domain-containing protein [Alcaligenaceae bacterium]
MPLPPSDVGREPLHTRTIRVESFVREDGQWDIEATLIDIKAYDFPKQDGSIQKAGNPIHNILLRITINDEFTITAAVAAYDAAPYNQHCSAIAPEYGDLVGMNLLRNFRQVVKDRYGRTAGCSHLSELAYVLPTVAVQTMANQRRKEKQTSTTQQEKRPFQLDGCHALRVDGDVAKEFYPKWYVAPATQTNE